jgi:diguanylate cyclase (GGDEF)-like protein
VVKRQRSAIFFALAFSMLLLGAAVLVMRGLGFLPTNLFTAYGVEYGSALEMLLLALALADRFNTLRREKAAAQQHLVEHLQSHERVLEARVLQRTEELKAANERLETLSVTDALTGIANRRRFDEVLASEWSRAARAGHPLAVALLDIDWFKRYNDHYGHPAGDECLRRVAAVLRDQVCRTGDLVARYGGEEFAFIAPASNGEDALAIARRICLALENLALSHQPSEFGCVSCSIGVAALTPAEGRSPDQLVKAADEALYRAKEQGRNRAVLAEA